MACLLLPPLEVLQGALEIAGQGRDGGDDAPGGSAEPPTPAPKQEPKEGPGEGRGDEPKDEPKDEPAPEKPRSAQETKAQAKAEQSRLKKLKERQVSELRALGKRPEGDPVLQRARLDLAKTLKSLGELKASLALYKTIHDVCEKKYPSGHSKLLSAKDDLAMAYWAMDDFKHARGLLEEILGTHNQKPESKYLLWVKDCYAKCLYFLKDYKSALPYAEEVYERRSKELPEGHVDLIDTSMTLAAVRIELGNSEGSLGILEDLENVAERARPRDEHLLRIVLTNKGAALGRLHHDQEALAVYERLMALCESLPEDDRFRLLGRLDYATSLTTAGRLEESLPICKDLLRLFSRKSIQYKEEIRKTRAELDRIERIGKAREAEKAKTAAPKKSTAPRKEARQEPGKGRP
jgi:FimV-like protein